MPVVDKPTLGGGICSNALMSFDENYVQSTAEAPDALAGASSTSFAGKAFFTGGYYPEVHHTFFAVSDDLIVTDIAGGLGSFITVGESPARMAEAGDVALYMDNNLTLYLMNEGLVCTPFNSAYNVFGSQGLSQPLLMGVEDGFLIGAVYRDPDADVGIALIKKLSKDGVLLGSYYIGAGGLDFNTLSRTKDYILFFNGMASQLLAITNDLVEYGYVGPYFAHTKLGFSERGGFYEEGAVTESSKAVFMNVADSYKNQIWTFDNNLVCDAYTFDVPVHSDFSGESTLFERGKCWNNGVAVVGSPDAATFGMGQTLHIFKYVDKPVVNGHRMVVDTWEEHTGYTCYGYFDSTAGTLLDTSVDDQLIWKVALKAKYEPAPGEPPDYGEITLPQVNFNHRKPDGIGRLKITVNDQTAVWDWIDGLSAFCDESLTGFDVDKGDEVTISFEWIPTYDEQ